MVAKRSDLSTVFAFVSVEGVDNKIIQGICRAIPGDGSALTKGFWRNLRHHGHNLCMGVVELAQHVPNGFLLACSNFAIVKVAVRIGELTQVGTSAGSSRRSTS